MGEAIKVLWLSVGVVDSESNGGGPNVINLNAWLERSQLLVRFPTCSLATSDKGPGRNDQIFYIKFARILASRFPAFSYFWLTSTCARRWSTTRA